MAKFGGKSPEDCGTTALMLAAENGHIDCVNLLINYEAGLVD